MTTNLAYWGLMMRLEASCNHCHLPLCHVVLVCPAFPESPEAPVLPDGHLDQASQWVQVIPKIKYPSYII